MGTDKISRHAYDKSFTTIFPDTTERKDGFQTHRKSIQIARSKTKAVELGCMATAQHGNLVSALGSIPGRSALI
jgi:hypothetical protein